MRLKLIAVAVAALVPVVTMLGYNEIVMRQQRNDEVRALAGQAARQASSEVERIIEGLRSLLVAITSMPAVRHLDTAACNEALASLASSVPNIRTIFVLRPDGSAVCGSTPMPAGTSFADRDYVRDAVASKGFVVGGYTKSRGFPTPPSCLWRCRFWMATLLQPSWSAGSDWIGCRTG